LFDAIGGNLKHGVSLSEVEWVVDGLSNNDHPHPDKQRRNEAAT
jgi:hypothetical protein